MDEENRFYVYAHYKTGEEDIPFYIGKGSNKRAFDKWQRSRHWKNVVNKHGLVVRILHENLSEEDAFWIEKKLIGMFGRADKGLGPLINHTDGGEGPSGIIQTEEHKEKNRQAQMGHHRGKGKTKHFTEEHIENMRLARLRNAGKPSPLLGKPKSESHVHNMIEAQQKRRERPDYVPPSKGKYISKFILLYPDGMEIIIEGINPAALFLNTTVNKIQYAMRNNKMINDVFIKREDI